MTKRLLTIQQAAKRTGYTVGTLYQYHKQGIFPPPRERRGKVMMFDPDDVAFFKEMRRRKRH